MTAISERTRERDGRVDFVGRWQRRRMVAYAIRTLGAAIPPIFSGVVTWQVHGLFWHGSGLLGTLVWLAQLAVIGTGLAMLAERAVREFIPLSHLYLLSLHFPDKAPSRFRVALRTGTITQQQKIIESVLDHGFSDDDVRAFEELVAMMVALHRHERLTRGHTERVRAYTDLLGAQLGLSAHDRHKLHWAALLHDIGKLAVPSELLSMAGKPNAEEWEILRRHPAHGAELVERFAGWLGEWRFSARDHHEWWNGEGYPFGRAGEDISLAGRIVAVADAYDVITSRRSYKAPISPSVARSELVRCAETQFDPTVVRAMLQIATGQLHVRAGRFGWLPSVSTVFQNAGVAAVLPLSAAASVIGFPLVAGALGAVEMSDPFALFTSGGPAATVEVADGSDPASVDAAARIVEPMGGGADTRSNADDEKSGDPGSGSNADEGAGTPGTGPDAGDGDNNDGDGDGRSGSPERDADDPALEADDDTTSSPTDLAGGALPVGLPAGSPADGLVPQGALPTERPRITVGADELHVEVPGLGLPVVGALPDVEVRVVVPDLHLPLDPALPPVELPPDLETIVAIPPVELPLDLGTTSAIPPVAIPPVAIPPVDGPLDLTTVAPLATAIPSPPVPTVAPLPTVTAPLPAAVPPVPTATAPLPAAVPPVPTATAPLPAAVPPVPTVTAPLPAAPLPTAVPTVAPPVPSPTAAPTTPPLPLPTVTALPLPSFS